MTDKWCGCSHLQTCRRCLHNHKGDPIKEQERQVQEMVISNRSKRDLLKYKISILTKELESLESKVRNP